MFVVLDMKADKLNSLFKCIRCGAVEQSKEFVSSSVKSIILLSSRDRPIERCKVLVDLIFQKQFCKVKVSLPACYIIQYTSDFLLLITARLNSQQTTGRQDLRLPAVSD